MKKWMNALIIWIPFEEGGRRNPIGYEAKYCPIIRFPGIKTEGVWSAEIFVQQTNGNESAVNISYLVLEAPFELLVTGARFELFEGSKKVATGIILDQIARDVE